MDVVDGTYRIISVSSGLVLDVPNNATIPVNIQQYPNNFGKNQEWSFINMGNPRGSGYKIVSMSSGLVLDVPNSATTQVNIEQWPDNGGASNQRWVLVPQPNGYIKIVS